MQITDYNQQAQDFLDKFGIKFRATLSDSKSPQWSDGEHGHHYRVTLSKAGPIHRLERVRKRGFRLTFDFWGSIADAKAGKTTVTPYNVLACISGDASCPETFEDFCGDYGYDQDSIKALQQFRRCSAFAKRLRAFFTDDELEALQEIQ